MSELLTESAKRRISVHKVRIENAKLAGRDDWLRKATADLAAAEDDLRALIAEGEAGDD